MTTTAINPESKKPKAEVKGLGKWKCSGCGKPTKVTPQRPAEKVTVDMTAVEQRVITELTKEVTIDVPATSAA
jgi:hypothetical protein